jgi:hypothetical protein
MHCEDTTPKIQKKYSQIGIARPQSNFHIYIFPPSVCLLRCRKICGLILGTHKSLTDTCMWKLGPYCIRPRNSFSGDISMGFSLQCACSLYNLNSEYTDKILICTTYNVVKNFTNPACRGAVRGLNMPKIVLYSSHGGFRLKRQK